MNRAWCWLAVGLLGACTSPPLEGGRYACVIDAGEDAQCPDDWRCGFEGYCHQPGDVSRPWRCESDLHCENGFSCGLDEKGDAGECHDPQGKVAHTCFFDSQCTAGWHCGKSGRCYDRAVPTDSVCRFDAGDCADNWRCGFNERCQNQDAGAAYPCGSDDSWCEQGWRCAPEGKCIDPASDALQNRAPPTVGAATKINPLIGFSPIDRFSVSPRYDAAPGAGFQTSAFVQEGKLQVHLKNRNDSTLVKYELGPWAGNVTFAAHGSRGRHPNSINLAVNDEVSRVFVSHGDGGSQMRVVELLPDGGFDSDDVVLFSPATRIITGTVAGPLSPRSLAFSPSLYAYSRLYGSAASVFPQELLDFAADPFADVPGNALVAMADIRATELIECVFAVDKRGLWVSQLGPVNDYNFEPIQLPPFTNDFCLGSGGPARTSRVTDIVTHGRDWLGYSAVALDGGEQSVGVIDLQAFWVARPNNSYCSSAMLLPCLSTDRIPVEMAFGPCSACPGGQLADFALVLDSVRQPKIELRCKAPGGTESFFTVSGKPGSTLCDRRAVNGEGALFAGRQFVKAEQPTPGQVAWASKDGYLWNGESTLGSIPQVFDRAATTLARSSTTLFAFTVDLSGVPRAGIGFATGPSAGVVAGVSHQPDWVVTRNHEVLALNGASVTQTADVAFVGTTVTPFDGPHHAEKTQAGASNTSLLVVTAGNEVFGAELIGSQPQLSLKVVSPSQIDSIAFPGHSPAGVYLRGYAVTPNGVLRLNADTSTRWTFSEVALPPQLAPLEVWFEGDRGRVGFTNGSVYSLPSRVKIADALADDVVDYAQTCGQQLVLSTGGLFRLEPKANSAVGDWKQIPLPLGFPTGGFAKGRLHALGSDVFVFARNGEAMQLTFATCPSPSP